LNVLIVDVNANDREMLRSALEHHGCTIIEAVDGLEGLDCAIHHQPDIIVSNTIMPRMDGFQLLWALKSDPKLTSIPFLFYSGTYTGEQETKLALSIGAEAFIVKQDAPQEVWECISAVLLSGKARQEPHVYPDINKNAGNYLWEYSRINATKLEEKVRELEETLIQRRKDEEELRTLHEKLALEIAEHKRAEEKIKEMEQEIAAIFKVAPFLMRQTHKMESAGFLTGSIAHEISNLPLIAVETEEETKKPEVIFPRVGKETILLAEDDESVRNMAMALLQHFGYEVIVAIDGEDAVMKYKEHAEKIHLLLFDLIMPKKTGNEAYDEIRRLKSDIKVMFASGHIQETAKQKILTNNNATFIFKPYLPTVFLQKVRYILDKVKT